MSQITISFDRYKAKHGDLLELHNNGYRVICPLCKADIIFSENTGSWCSKNPNHYETHIYKKSVRDELRGISRKFQIKEMKENLTKKGYSEAQIQAEINKYYPN